MRPISDTTRSVGNSKTPGETGDIADSFAGKNYNKELIQQANTVPLVAIFKHYGLRLNEYNKKIACPFKSHKNGRENTPSFYYYPDTNSFHCFGCGIGHKGTHGCEFVAAMENITRAAAANKIIKLFESYVDEDIIVSGENFSEQLEIMMDFSNAVRAFRQSHSSEHSSLFIEHVCAIYDRLHAKHKDLNNEALRSIVEQLKEKINSYTPCLMLSF